MAKKACCAQVNYCPQNVQCQRCLRPSAVLTGQLQRWLADIQRSPRGAPASPYPSKSHNVCAYSSQRRARCDCGTLDVTHTRRMTCSKSVPDLGLLSPHKVSA